MPINVGVFGHSFRICRFRQFPAVPLAVVIESRWALMETDCEDLLTAEEIIYELWRRQDEGCKPVSWTRLMTECDKYVLLI
jgi:hypothetical protein